MEGLGFPEPPADDEVRGRLTQRKDDTEERVRERLEQYRDTHQTADVMEAFRTRLAVDGSKEASELLPDVLAFLHSSEDEQGS